MASEVKGSWFVALRAWLECADDRALLDRIIRRLPPDHAAAVVDPIASNWYPEETLAAALHAVDVELCKGDRARFTDVMDACTEIGVSRFFRVFLRMTSARFLLRNVPTMWKQIRRGAGRVEVVERDGAIDLHYSEFPYFADPLYEALTVGSLRSIVRVCVGETLPVSVIRRGPAELTVRVAVP